MGESQSLRGTFSALHAVLFWMYEVAGVIGVITAMIMLLHWSIAAVLTLSLLYIIFYISGMTLGLVLISGREHEASFTFLLFLTGPISASFIVVFTVGAMISGAIRNGR